MKCMHWDAPPPSNSHTKIILIIFLVGDPYRLACREGEHPDECQCKFTFHACTLRFLALRPQQGAFSLSRTLTRHSHTQTSTLTTNKLNQRLTKKQMRNKENESKYKQQTNKQTKKQTSKERHKEKKRKERKKETTKPTKQANKQPCKYKCCKPFPTASLPLSVERI